MNDARLIRKLLSSYPGLILIIAIIRIAFNG
jgi:hypothetical protein